MNRRTVLDIANPINRRGGGPLIHVLLIAVALLIAFLAGAFTAHHLDRNYYASHYQAPLKVPQAHTVVHASRRAAAVPDSGGIFMAYYRAGINDQGPLGSCQSWSFAKQLSYAYNWNYPHHARFYSPRYLYDAVSNGQDQGSYVEQYLPVVNQFGAARFNQFPYGYAAPALGYPAYAIENPVPPSIAQAATAYPLKPTEQVLFGNPGAGPGGLALIQSALATHHMVNIDIPVYPEWDAANSTGSYIDAPKPGELDRGGHAVVAVAYKPGWVEISNQWYGWGIGAAHLAWISDSLVENYVWGAVVIHVPNGVKGHVHAGRPTAGTTSSADGGTIKRHLPPYTFQKKATVHAPNHAAHLTAPTSPADARKVGTSWYVQNVRATNGADLSALINQWGDYYHIWPLGLAATVGTESGYNINAERWAGGLDNSCGLLQQIVTNVYPVIGNYNARAACDWEEVPGNSIYLGARLYADYVAYQHGCVRWEFLYGEYNAGPGFPCDWYYHMTGQAYQNFAFNFMPNYQWALDHFQSFSKPQPQPKPTPKPIHHNTRHYSRASWCRSARSHHLRCPSAFYGHHLSTIAFQWVHWHHAFHGKRSLNSVAGGVIGAEHWNAKAKVVHQRFAHAWCYEWSQEPGAPTKWAHARTWHKGMKT